MTAPPYPSSEPDQNTRVASDGPDAEKGFQELDVRIPCGGSVITGDLIVPPWAQGVVLFASGTGSNRHSPRSQFVAGKVQAAGMATLLLDLVTPAEEAEEAATGHSQPNINLQMQRMIESMRWVRRHPLAGRHAMAFYGASTGAATALVTAAKLGPLVRAVVSRGGRIDLTGQVLPLISAPTLLIVGGADASMEPLNRGAMVRLRCPKELAVVPKASHLFEEPGALEEVAAHTVRWFQQHLLTVDRKDEDGASHSA